MKQYIILMARNPFEMQTLVEDYLAQNCVLVGGLQVVTAGPNTFLFFQAVAKGG